MGHGTKEESTTAKEPVMSMSMNKYMSMEQSRIQGEDRWPPREYLSMVQIAQKERHTQREE